MNLLVGLYTSHAEFSLSHAKFSDQLYAIQDDFLVIFWVWH